MSEMKLPEAVTLKISEIKPYDNNPRVIDERSKEVVEHSLKTYGYVQPLVVDTDHVIIVGHTRFQAMQALGVKEVSAYVVDLPEEQAREYRIADNRTGELTHWDGSSLTMELREMEDSVLRVYFPEVDIELGHLKTAMRKVTEEEMGQATREVTSIPVRTEPLMTEVQCPECMGLFEVKTSTLGLTWEDLMLLESRRDGE